MVEATVVDVAPGTFVDEEARDNVLRLRAHVDDATLTQQPKPGTTVISQIACGRASIAYCKAYEFVDWFRRIWFKVAG